MITKIHIKDKATIKDVLIEPLKINYFFGGNGTGKTTISKFLSNKDNYSTNVIEKNDDYEILVYNKDFVDNYFQDKNAIHGIFTIGESAVDAEKQIAEQENIKKEKEKDKETKEKSLAKLQTEINQAEIIIIDDPISSLDSNILFIVSYLVRELINNCLSNKNIKQIFVLTHNIYFHQEITYHGSRANPFPKEERFWILRKVNEVTIIKGYEKNQISSSYELLWQEYRNPDTDASLICNTVRRILEHYFNVIGHHDYNSIIDQFTGQDRLICKSLLTFINTGSHLINDDFHLSVDPDMVDKYKEVFRIIFQKANQESHYNMMMGI